MTILEIEEIIEELYSAGLQSYNASELENLVDECKKYGADLQINQELINHWENDTLDDFIQLEMGI